MVFQGYNNSFATTMTVVGKYQNIKACSGNKNVMVNENGTSSGMHGLQSKAHCGSDKVRCYISELELLY